MCNDKVEVVQDPDVILYCCATCSTAGQHAPEPFADRSEATCPPGEHHAFRLALTVCRHDAPSKKTKKKGKK